MTLDDKPFEQLTADDILALIPGVAESRRLDYKATLPEDGEKGVRSFLNDVCALANSAGGFLVYGVDEERDEDGNQTGVPASVCGLVDLNEDEAIRDWQQRITQNIEPRIIGHRVGFINDFEDGRKVMVVHVQKSLFAPHRVNYQGKKEFYVRHDRCNLPMDIGEIRHAFVEAREIPQRIDEYRRLRISRILAGETPVELLSECAMFAAHVIPLSSFAEDAAVDVTSISERMSMRAMGTSTAGGRLNADGYLFRSGIKGDYERGYVQVFRTGAIEMCSAITDIPGADQHGVLSLPSEWQEDEYVKFVAASIGLLKALGVQPPVYVGLSLLRVKGARMARPPRFSDRGDVIDKDILIVPTVTSETMSEPTDRLMRPAFDAVWQASGLPASPYYDEGGNWTGK